MKKYLYILLVIASVSVSDVALSQNEPPQSFTLDGRFTEPNSTDPLLEASIAVTIQVLNPAKTCILYEEQQTISTLATNGYFSVRVGSALGAGKRTTFDSANSMNTVFYNSTAAITGKNSGGGGCSYVPISGDARYFRFFITPSSTGQTAQLSPDMTLDSVPQAIVAQTLQGLGPDDVFRTSATSTQGKLDNLLTANYTNITDLISGTSTQYLHNAATGTLLPTRATDPTSPSPGQMWYDSATNEIKYYNGSAVTAVGAAGSGVSSITAGSGLSGGTISTSGTIAIAAGGVANSHLATGIDASKVTVGTLPVGVVPTGTDTTKLPLAGGTLTGALTLGAATTFGGFDLLGTGHITMTAQRTITIGKYDSTQQSTTLVPLLTPANAGATWYNSTTGKLMYWNGTAALEISESTTAGGDITAINTNAGSGLTGGVTSGPATLAVNVDDSTIEIATNTIQIKTGGVNTNQLAAASVTDVKLAGDAVTSAKILDGAIVNADINASAAIAWSKIDKTGATATDVGAVPTVRAINTNSGSGLTGGGNLSADRSLAINVDDSTIEIATNTVQIKDGGVTNTKINSVNVAKITNGAADYFSYMPAGSECASGGILIWNLTSDRWECGTLPTVITAHSGLSGLSADDHTQYAMLAGRAGGQSVIGGTAASNNLSLESTSDSTKGDVLLQPNGGNVGIGTTAPLSTVHISDGNAVDPALITSDKHVITHEGSAAGNSIVVAGNSAIYRSVFKGTRARGTLASPAAPLVDDLVLSILGNIYDGAANQATAAVDFQVDGAVSTGVAPQRISFVTSETTGATRSEKMTIKANGNVGIGSTSPNSLLDVAGTIRATEICDEAGGNCKDISSGWGAGGDIDGITTHATTSALTGGTASGTANLSVVNDGITIETNGSNQLQIKDSGVTSAKIANGAIVDADINTSAAIAWSKINKSGATATDVGAVATTRTVTAGNGLTGGGALSANITVDANVDGTTLEVVTDTIQVKDSGITNAKINTVNVSKIVSGGADYFTYMPAGSECASGGILIWNITSDRWECGTLPTVVTAHSGLTGLGADDHTQYALLTGRVGGQSVIGGTAASNNLSLESTSNVTKGNVLIQPNGGNVGLGTTSPKSSLQVGTGFTLSGGASTNNAVAFNSYFDGVDARWESLGAGYGGLVWQDRTTGKLTISTGTVNTGAADTATIPNTGLVMDNAGNVGIGTTAPTTTLDLSAKTDALRLPAGTTGQQPTAANGMIRYNTTTNRFEGYENGGWVAFRSPADNSTFVSATGTAAAPSISFTGEGDTGFYNSGTNAIGVSAGGAQVFQINTSGIVSPTTGGANILTGNGTAATPTFSFSGDTDTGWFRPTDNTMAASTDGVERVRIDPLGQVGIGTTNPQYKLEVSNGTDSTGLTSNALKLNRAAGGASYIDVTGIGSGLYFRNSNVAYLDSIPLSITSGGNVGIGTTSPLGILHTTADTNANMIFERNTASTSGPNFWFYKSRGTSSSKAAVSNGDTLTQIQFYGYDGSAYQSGAEINVIADGTISSGNVPAAVRIFTTPTSGSATERLRISSSGNVGIGTTTPSGLLDVYSSADTLSSSYIQNANTGASAGQRLIVRTSGAGDAALMFQESNGASSQWSMGLDQSDSGSFKISTSTTIGSGDRLTIDTSGNVGIGTTSPVHRLDITSANTMGAFPMTVANAGARILETGPHSLYFDGNSMVSDTTSALFLGTTTAFPVIVGTNNAEVVRIASGGNVGIGTSNPTAKLDVSGTLNVNAGTAAAATPGAAISIVGQSGGAGDVAGGSILMRTGSPGSGATSALPGTVFIDNADSNSILQMTAYRSGSNYRNAAIVFRGPRSDTADGSSHPGRGFIILPGQSSTSGSALMLGAQSANADYQSNDVATLRSANQNLLEIGSGGHFRFWAAGTEYARIANGGDSFFVGGNVGIGTTAPTSTLTVRGSFARNIATVTAATHTVSSTDTHIICNRAGTITLTLPAAASFSGREISIRTITANTVVSASSNVVPMAGGAAGTSILSATAGKWALLISDGTNWQVQMGN